MSGSMPSPAPGPSETAAQGAPAIEALHLSVSFGSVPGVIDLSFQVREGEVFGFLGPNGAGKTTTIRLLLDLLRPDQGEARLFGAEVRKTGGGLRARLGFLPGDLVLFPWLTGEETLSLLADLMGQAPVLREHILCHLGFPLEALSRRVRTYSTGMRQMIGITGAFQHDPDLLILDEPTTGLDPLVREAFLELVRERREGGKTVFISSHVLEEIERCADRVGLIHGSRLRLVESVQSLRQSRPLQVLLRYRDGRELRFHHSGEPGTLLKTIDHDGLTDVEIRPASLKEVFRAVVGAGEVA